MFLFNLAFYIDMNIVGGKVFYKHFSSFQLKYGVDWAVKPQHKQTIELCWYFSYFSMKAHVVLEAPLGGASNEYLQPMLTKAG